MIFYFHIDFLLINKFNLNSYKIVLIMSDLLFKKNKEKINQLFTILFKFYKFIIYKIQELVTFVTEKLVYVVSYILTKCSPLITGSYFLGLSFVINYSNTSIFAS